MRDQTVFRYIDDVAQSGSVRRTAERLNISPSALTRRIQAFEQELGAPVFERLSHGMRPNAAGELLLRHIRRQAAEFERVRAAIADLSGLRLGHVTIACSQAFVDRLLPSEIEAFRARYPAVTFRIQVRDYALGVAALTTLEADLAWLVSPPASADLHVLNTGRVTLCALMHRDHPLAGEGPVRLRDCLRHKLAIPDPTLAVRQLLDDACARTMMPMDVQVESGSIDLLRQYVLRERLVSFQITVGSPFEPAALHSRPIDARDLSPASIVFAQLRGRTLSLAATEFAAQVSASALWL